MATMAAQAPTGGAVAPVRNHRTLLMVVCAVAIAAISVDAAVEAALGGNKLLLIVPIGGFAGIGLVALGVVKFENFVLFTIALRSSLDITKPSSGNTGAAGVSAGASTSGLDPAGALAILFLLMAFLWFLTRHREGRKSPPASIHRVALIIFCIAGFVSVLELLGCRLQHPQRHQGRRRDGDARRAGGDAGGPGRDPAHDRRHLPLRGGAQSVTRWSWSSPITPSSRAAALPASRGRSPSPTRSPST